MSYSFESAASTADPNTAQIRRVTFDADEHNYITKTVRITGSR